MNIKRHLPIAGIVAFSLCSTTSIYHLLASHALNPSPVLWLPAVLVELVTAWAVYQIVEQARQVTKSNISKQDKRFYSGILGAFGAVALPMLGTSVWANSVEFQSIILGALFPIASVACAVGAALPDATQKYSQAKANERQSNAKEREERAKERQAKAKESQEQANREQARRQMLANLGKSAPVYELYRADPGLTQADAAQKLSLSRQAVGYHLDKLEAAGAIRRNGEGVEIVQGGES